MLSREEQMAYTMTGRYNIYTFVQDSNGNYTETILRYNTVRGQWQQVTTLKNLKETTVQEKITVLQNKGFVAA